VHQRLNAAAGVSLDRSSYWLTDVESLRLSDLAEVLHTDLSTVSRQVQAAERAGLVERRPDPSDGRASRVYLTAGGRAALERLRAVQRAEIRAAIAGGGWEVEAAGQRFTLTDEDVSVQESSRAPWVAQADGALAVAVDTTLDEELRAEGLVREFAHRIQTLRRGAEFDVTDRIRLFWELSPGLAAAAARYEQFIREEVLAEEIVPRVTGNGPSEEWTFDGERARVGIERVHKGG